MRRAHRVLLLMGALVLLSLSTPCRGRHISHRSLQTSSASSTPTVVVTFTDNTNITAINQYCDKLKAESPDKCKIVFQSLLQGFAGKLDDEDIAGIRRAFGANVESVDVSTKFQTLSSAGTAMVASEPGTDTTGDASYQALQLSTAFPPWTQVNPQWPLQRVNNRNFNQSAGAALPYAFEAPGSGVNAYLVDTGLRFSHEEFGQFPAGGGTPRAVHGMSAFGDDDSSDCNGHGTHNAASLGGLSYGVAKNATLWSVRAVDCDGTTSVVDLLQGLEWVARSYQRPALVNLSLRAVGDSLPLTLAVSRLTSRYSIPVFVAAGNDASNACASIPANATGAIAVAASAQDDAAWADSNWGPCVGLYAPGVNILSASWTSDTAVSVLSGTSMSCPVAAGMAAQLLQDAPDLTPAQIRAQLQGSALQDMLVIEDSDTPNLLAFNGLPADQY